MKSDKTFIDKWLLIKLSKEERAYILNSWGITKKDWPRLKTSVFVEFVNVKKRKVKK